MSAKNKLGQQLRGFIERVEKIEADKKVLGDDRKAVMAEAKAAGFDTKVLGKIIKLRAIDPGKVAEEQALMDTYMHAIGMEAELPLFQQIGKLGGDPAMRETVIEACSALVPLNGEITITSGGAKVRLWRDSDGNVHAEDVVDLGHVVVKEPRAPKPTRSEEDEIEIARERGRKAAREAPGSKNPYAKGDKMHAEWNAGFREEMDGVT